MVPDFQSIMLPMLESSKEGGDFTDKQMHDALEKYLELTDEEVNELLPGSDQTLFYHNLIEAQSHLLMAGLLERASGDYFKITPLGKQVLHKRPNVIDTNYLRRFPGYVEAAKG